MFLDELESNEENTQEIVPPAQAHLHYVLISNDSGGTLGAAEAIISELEKFDRGSVSRLKPDKEKMKQDTSSRRFKRIVDYHLRNKKICWDFLGSYIYKNKKTNKKFRTKVANFVSQENPDVICATSPRAAHSAALARQDARKENIPLAVVLTNQGDVPYYRIIPQADAIIVPGEVSKDSVIKQGIPSEKVYVYGRPVHQKFEEILGVSKKELRDRLGEELNIPNNENTKIALVVAGSKGSKALGPTVKALLKENLQNLHLIIIAGKNEELLKELEGLVGQNGGHSAKVFGTVNNMHELLRLSDVFITKAGGGAVAEGLTTRTPMIINDYWTKYEKQNADYVKSTGSGVIAENPSHVVKIMRKVLDQPERLQTIIENQEKTSPRRSAKKTANLLRDLAVSVQRQEQGQMEATEATPFLSGEERMDAGCFRTALQHVRSMCR